jgi:hypothetical protein
MGYSVAAVIKSKKARDAMLSFLQAHYRSWGEVLQAAGVGADSEAYPHPDYDPTVCVLRDGELSYDHGKIRIGFDYSNQTLVGPYMYAIVRWICLKIGRKRAFEGLAEKTPYYMYDGYAGTPVLEGACSDRWMPYACDTLGIPFIRIGFEYYFSAALKARLEAILREELQRLDRLWEAA